MARVIESRKACAVNPLKMSQPLGAAYAFMGLAQCMPLMHGSQGCTSFGLVLLVRHFKEAIPLQTSAMNEVTTILGGLENLESALLNIRKRAAPKLIAICSTGLTETKGDDVDGYLRLIRQRHPELADTELVYVSTPDYIGAFEDGWSKAVSALVRSLAREQVAKVDGRVNLLPGSHLTPADIDELREIIESFGLEVVVAPDMSGSLDGHIPEEWLGTTIGGTALEDLQNLGSAMASIAVGEQMRSAAMELEMRCGVPFEVFDRLTGLLPNDRFLQHLSQLSGRPVPAKYRRSRSQLLDAMLDGHFHFGQVKLAIGAEPDLLWAVGSLLQEMGAQLAVCVTTTQSMLLQQLPCEEVLIGDLEDMERLAAERGCELLLTHSHGRQMAERLGLPLYRIGMPLFDRIGNAHRLSVGYRGTRNLIFDIANLLADQTHQATPESWPLPEASRRAASVSPESHAEVSS
ncbi:nitrogenase molybdenum-iron protein NifN [Solimonas aquatica]|uniref:Nitrogenase iron-molybdenum cofactor biosynthesis protein NifN n=1 Tax=Solimonas aquatica TaxID=489703 RepID=A0A1H9IS14_9GAMM|nr:nitrogenase iron-molybdenum cofactor biosynthesis protein NifN [Solimonas aquatica]SEQ77307.1 nitrogenase molybdenum-iron protein NifN [Solimonas aquatica]